MKKSLITGLIIVMPITLTILLFVFLINFFTNPFVDLVRPIVSSWHIAEPEIITLIARVVSLILVCLSIFLLGVIARWFFIRPLIKWSNVVLSKIPVVKSIYKVTKDIVSAFFSPEGRKAFKYPVMVPFPLEKSYCVGFASGEVPKECLDKSKIELSPIFIPTAPHPISGYLVMVPKDKVSDIAMTNEEAVKFTVSCGVIVPEEIKDES